LRHIAGIALAPAPLGPLRHLLLEQDDIPDQVQVVLLDTPKLAFQVGIAGLISAGVMAVQVSMTRSTLPAAFRRSRWAR
jgi:hypothetical protein